MLFASTVDYHSHSAKLNIKLIVNFQASSLLFTKTYGDY